MFFDRGQMTSWRRGLQFRIIFIDPRRSTNGSTRTGPHEQWRMNKRQATNRRLHGKNIPWCPTLIVSVVVTQCQEVSQDLGIIAGRVEM